MPLQQLVMAGWREKMFRLGIGFWPYLSHAFVRAIGV